MDYSTLSNGELAKLGNIGASEELDRRVISAQESLKKLSNDQLIMRALAQMVTFRDRGDVEGRAFRDELKSRG